MSSEIISRPRQTDNPEPLRVWVASYNSAKYIVVASSKEKALEVFHRSIPPREGDDWEFYEIATDKEAVITFRN